MSAELMIKSDLDGYVIEIKGNSTMGGVPLVADPAAVGQSLNKPAKFSADQAWKVLSDPAGSIEGATPAQGADTPTGQGAQ